MDFGTVLYLHGDTYINLWSTSQAWSFLKGGRSKRMMTKILKISYLEYDAPI